MGYNALKIAEIMFLFSDAGKSNEIFISLGFLNSKLDLRIKNSDIRN
jgi:hypothetical protein